MNVFFEVQEIFRVERTRYDFTSGDLRFKEIQGANILVVKVGYKYLMQVGKIFT